MAGIYIHIPFCRKACHYCNFHFSTSFNNKDDLIEAIGQEIILQKDYLHEKSIETIYFGGGTPSALPPADIQTLLSAIFQHYPVTPTAEITLEANPDDISMATLNAWKVSGINRLSLGIQAFQDPILKEWNRTHNAQQAMQSLEWIREAGYTNITADLIYGGDKLTDEEWRYNISQLTEKEIPHTSAYALTVEAGTVLAHRIKTGKATPPDDEQANRQYEILQSTLSNAGYEQYEVSNFAKPGFRSKHNQHYWSGGHYLGIGPSAHSFNGISRQWNIAHNLKYINAIRHQTIPFEKEILTETQRYNELVMTGLRTEAGIDISRLRQLPPRYEDFLLKVASVYIGAGKMVVRENGNMALIPSQFIYADGIASSLFYE